VNSDQATKDTKEQLTRIQLEVVKVLPEALRGIPYEEVIRLIDNGRLVGTLNSAFRSAVSKKQEQIDSRDTFKYNKAEQKWTLLEDNKEREILPVGELELAVPFKDEETCIFGHELIKRAVKTKNNFSQRQAEYLLENQDKIPLDWRPFCIIFPGTIWADSANRPSVPYIVYETKGWNLSFYWVNRPFAGVSRLLQSR
jgi:hypothetical protein